MEGHGLWRREQEVPTMLVFTNSFHVQTALAGDAQVTPHAAVGPLASGSASKGSAISAPDNDYGRLGQNRRGVPLCQGFHSSQCTGGSRGSCPRDGSLVHHCESAYRKYMVRCV